MKDQVNLFILLQNGPKLSVFRRSTCAVAANSEPICRKLKITYICIYRIGCLDTSKIFLWVFPNLYLSIYIKSAETSLER